MTIRALRVLLDTLTADSQLPRLVIAGGYDVRLAENRLYFAELQKEAANLGLKDEVGKDRFFQKEKGAIKCLY